MKLDGRPVILLGEGDSADAKRRLLERAGAVVSGEDTQGALLAIIAIEEEDEAQAAVVRLKARGILVNAVDRPALCDFTLPAIVDRDPVLVAVGTGGASAGLAKMVRQRIEAILPPRIGRLAQALHSARAAIRVRWPDSSGRRRALDAALAPGGLLDPLVPQTEGAVARWLAGDVASPAEGLHAITLSSPDPDDLTLRVARLLGEADRIYHGPDVPTAILVRARADAARIATDRLPTSIESGLSLWLEMAR